MRDPFYYLLVEEDTVKNLREQIDDAKSELDDIKDKINDLEQSLEDADSTLSDIEVAEPISSLVTNMKPEVVAESVRPNLPDSPKAELAIAEFRKPLKSRPIEALDEQGLAMLVKMTRLEAEFVDALLTARFFVEAIDRVEAMEYGEFVCEIRTRHAKGVASDPFRTVTGELLYSMANTEMQTSRSPDVRLCVFWSVVEIHFKPSRFPEGMQMARVDVSFPVIRQGRSLGNIEAFERAFDGGAYPELVISTD